MNFNGKDLKNLRALLLSGIASSVQVALDIIGLEDAHRLVEQLPEPLFFVAYFGGQPEQGKIAKKLLRQHLSSKLYSEIDGHLRFFRRAIPQKIFDPTSPLNSWKAIKADMAVYERNAASYERLIKEYPVYAKLYTKVGQYLKAGLMLLPGSLTIAARYYKKTLDLIPDHLHALEGLAQIYALQKDWPKARIHCKKVLEISPHSFICTRLLDKVIPKE